MMAVELNIYSRDDEKGPVFDNFICDGQRIGHAPEDAHLEEISVFMAPDRVVGLGGTPQLKCRIEAAKLQKDHALIDGKEVYDAFLLIEAKKEKNAPGFRAIEMQTAFPVRRLLQIQSNLDVVGDGSIKPLVWFFAYQGDDWRLYGATLQSQVVVRFSFPITHTDGVLTLR